MERVSAGLALTILGLVLSLPMASGQDASPLKEATTRLAMKIKAAEKKGGQKAVEAILLDDLKDLNAWMGGDEDGLESYFMALLKKLERVGSPRAADEVEKL